MLAALGFAVAGALAGARARLLLGRLRRGARVPPPWCELAAASAWAVTGAAWAAGAVPAAWMPALLGLGWLGVAAGAVDLRHRRLPDALTLPALPAAVLLVVPVGLDAVPRALAGAAVLAAGHAAVHLLAPQALGAGDVKLAAPLGAVLAAGSWPTLGFAVALAAVLTGVAAAVALACRALTRSAALPHGPSLLLASWLAATAAAAGAG